MRAGHVSPSTEILIRLPEMFCNRKPGHLPPLEKIRGAEHRFVGLIGYVCRLQTTDSQNGCQPKTSLGVTLTTPRANAELWLKVSALRGAQFLHLGGS